MLRLESSQLKSDTSRLQCAEVDFRRIKGDTKQRGVVRSAGNFRPTIRFTHTAIINRNEFRGDGRLKLLS